MVRAQERLGDSWLARFTHLGRIMNRVVSISPFMAHPSAQARAAYDKVPADVARLLQKAGVEFGCLYEDDLYSGALAYDLGADEVLAEHAQRVYRTLKRHGVRRVITIDPHTTNMLRSVYPTIIKGYDLEVLSYLEVLWERQPAVLNRLSGEVALHDSCVFARYEHIVKEPRELLARAGIAVREPANAGNLTWCCGGPVESLYPKKALANAERRVDQLRQAAPRGVTMCPLCLVNLQKAAGETMRFEDISHYLCNAYGAKETGGGAS